MRVLTVGKEASAGIERAARYARHRPEQTLLYQIVQTHTQAFVAELAARERTLPDYVQREFEDYLACGRLENGFLRVRCNDCHAERLVAFSCKRRGSCPSCGARRMAESAALLVDEIFPRLPIRQWVLSVPFALRFLLAREPQVISAVLGIVYRAIASYLIHQAGLTAQTAQTGAVTLIDDARPCAPPFGHTACVPIGSPADWSTLWQRAQLEYPLPHAIPGRRLPHHGIRPELSSSQGANPCRVRAAGAYAQ